MSENIQIWLFGLTGGWLLALTVLVNNMRLANVKTQIAVDLFIDSLGKNLAKALHQDDDRHQMDALIDQYVAGHYDLPPDDWRRWKELCKRVIDNPKSTDFEKTLAIGMNAVCTHKLHRYENAGKPKGLI